VHKFATRVSSALLPTPYPAAPLRARAVAPPRRPASLTLRRTGGGRKSRCVYYRAEWRHFDGTGLDGLVARARVVRTQVASMEEASALVGVNNPSTSLCWASTKAESDGLTHRSRKA
jgi:hypothetical protein